MTDLATPDPGTPRDFAAFLLEQSRGKTHRELSEALRDLVSRVRETGRKGSLQYTLVVEPMRGDDLAVMTSDDVKLRLPQFDRPGSVFYVDDGGDLIRDDPRQASLFEPAPTHNHAR